MKSAAAKPAVSVVIPTHNPRMDYLARVLEALRHQRLPCEQWELLVVDNGSKQLLKVGAGPRDSRSEGKTGRRGDQRTKSLEVGR